MLREPGASTRARRWVPDRRRGDPDEGWPTRGGAKRCVPCAAKALAIGATPSKATRASRSIKAPPRRDPVDLPDLARPDDEPGPRRRDATSTVLGCCVRARRGCRRRRIAALPCSQPPRAGRPQEGGVTHSWWRSPHGRRAVHCLSGTIPRPALLAVQSTRSRTENASLDEHKKRVSALRTHRPVYHPSHGRVRSRDESRMVLYLQRSGRLRLLHEWSPHRRRDDETRSTHDAVRSARATSRSRRRR